MYARHLKLHIVLYHRGRQVEFLRFSSIYIACTAFYFSRLVKRDIP